QRRREFLHFQPNPVIGLPLHNLFNMARPIQVGDSDTSANDTWRLDVELSNLDARYRPVAVEVGPLRQVENLPGDVFGSQRQCFITGEGDRFHLALPSHAFSIAASGSGSASRWSSPTSTSAEAGSPLFLTSSSLSANGTTSSARLCRITVPGFTFLAVP